MIDREHDGIERLLREDAARPVADGGFTQRVANALPPPRSARPWLRPVLVLGSAALGSVLAWLLAPAGTSLAQGFVDLARQQANTPSAFAAAGLALAMAVIAAVLVSDEG